MDFFGAIQMISCRDWWPWTKPGYVTMTRRQSNNQWSGGIAAHPAPNNAECKNPLEKFWPRFLWIRTASSSLIVFQRAKLSMRSYTHLCWCNWRKFWRKNAAESSPRGSCSCTTIPWITGHWQARRNWPTWASKVWWPSPFSECGPFGLPAFPWTEEKQLEGSHLSFDAGVIAATETRLDGQMCEFFWVACKVGAKGYEVNRSS
jgi:hypothetical protein